MIVDPAVVRPGFSNLWASATHCTALKASTFQDEEFEDHEDTCVIGYLLGFCTPNAANQAGFQIRNLLLKALQDAVQICLTGIP